MELLLWLWNFNNLVQRQFSSDRNPNGVHLGWQTVVVRKQGYSNLCRPNVAQIDFLKDIHPGWLWNLNNLVHSQLSPDKNPK